MGLGIAERIQSPQEQQQRSQDNASAKMRVAIPGIIQSFDPETQTVTVQPAIREKVNGPEGGSMMEIPMLLDVPVVFPNAGGFSITLPIQSGDECLVIFADMCIDAWWQSGGVQNQLETRRHDLSDGFAIIGVSSVPNAIESYSEDGIQIRNGTGDTFIEITKENDINLVSKQNINIKSEEDITIEGRTITTTQTGG